MQVITLRRGDRRHAMVCRDGLAPASVDDGGGRAISIKRDRPERVVQAVHTDDAAVGTPGNSANSIGSVFERYIDTIYHFCQGQVGNRHDSEDLTSEVFLKAARNLDPRRSEAEIRRWLFTVTRSVIADYWRRLYRLPPLLDIDGVDPAAPVRVVTDGADGGEDRVERILAAIPDRQAQVLRLRFLHGYTLSECAVELGVTIGNVKVTQHRALAAAVRAADEMK